MNADLTDMVAPATQSLTLVLDRADSLPLHGGFFEVNSAVVCQRGFAAGGGQFVLATLMPLDLECLLCRGQRSSRLLIRVEQRHSPRRLFSISSISPQQGVVS